jgi:hypothetical protein
MKPRCLICVYDSDPIIERVLVLCQKLKPLYELFVFVQFPKTLKLLERNQIEAFLYRSVIGWEHGNLKDVVRLPSRQPHESYEARTYGDNFDWALFEENLRSRIYSVFDALQPDLLLVWNGHTLPNTEFVRVAKTRAIPIRHMERGFFPGSIFIDPQGTNARASFRDQTLFEKDLQKLGAQVSRVFKSRYRPIVGSEEAPLSHSEWTGNGLKALFIEQLDHDTNIVLFSSAYPSNEAALTHLKASLPTEAFQLLVKEHPEQSSKREHTNQGAEYMVTNGNLKNLLLEADFVLTRNSSVGFEALIFGKPVVALGEAFYDRFTSTLENGAFQVIDAVQQGEIDSFIGQIFNQNHLFIDPKIAKDYPETTAFGLLDPTQLELEHSRKRTTRTPLWRNRFVKRFQSAVWQMRLQVRALKSRLGWKM